MVSLIILFAYIEDDDDDDDSEDDIKVGYRDTGNKSTSLLTSRMRMWSYTCARRLLGRLRSPAATSADAQKTGASLRACSLLACKCAYYLSASSLCVYTCNW
uniref:Uncharacterized protein n=1 Tax=Trichogramma kaykai TaxID=54128 RepID=A0ABD2WNA8_9HYME